MSEGHRVYNSHDPRVPAQDLLQPSLHGIHLRRRSKIRLNFTGSTYLLSPSLEKKTVKVWMLPFASAGGRQLRRMNRLETKTGTTSLGADGRTLGLGIAEEEEKRLSEVLPPWAGKMTHQQTQDGTFTNQLKEEKQGKAKKWNRRYIRISWSL